MLKVYQLVLKSKSRKFSSQKIKFPGISPKRPQKEAFIVVGWMNGCSLHGLQKVLQIDRKAACGCRQTLTVPQKQFKAQPQHKRPNLKT